MKTFTQNFFFICLILPLSGVIISCEEEKSDPFPGGTFEGVSFSYSYAEGDSLTLNFTNTTTNEEATTFEWDFGDGMVTTGENVSHTYADGGTYTVELTGFSPEGSGVHTKEVLTKTPPPAPEGPFVVHTFASESDAANTVKVSFQEPDQCFGNEITDGEAVNFGVANPDPNADFPVTQYVRGTAQFADIKFNTFAGPLDLNRVNRFQLEVYFPSSNDYSGDLTRTVELILADGTDCGGFFNDWVIKSKTIFEADLDKWITLTFDFSNVTDRTDLNWMILRLGGSNHFTSGTFYIHNLVSQEVAPDYMPIAHTLESEAGSVNATITFQDADECFPDEITEGEAVNFGVSNPDPGYNFPVTEYVRGTFQFADIKFNSYTSPLNLTESNQFSLEVYFPSSNDYSGDLAKTVSLILADGTDCGGFFNDWVVKTVTIPDEQLDRWVTVRFDFSNVSDRTDLSWMILQFGGTNHFTSGTFYMHNLQRLD